MLKQKLGLTAATAGLGLLISGGAAQAQAYFNYSTVYNSGASGNVASGGGTATLPGPPTDTTHPFFTITPEQNLSGGGTPTNITLLQVRSSTGSMGLTDTQVVSVNQTFSLTISLNKADSSGSALGPAASYVYNASFQGTLTNSSDTVGIKPNPSTTNTNFSLISGSSVYNVSINAFAPPGYPGGSNSTGILSALVDSSDFAVPEPGAYGLLAGVVLPGAWFAFKLRRRRRS